MTPTIYMYNMYNDPGIMIAGIFSQGKRVHRCFVKENFRYERTWLDKIPGQKKNRNNKFLFAFTTSFTSHGSELSTIHQEEELSDDLIKKNE